jgi:hypothetical protein
MPAVKRIEDGDTIGTDHYHLTVHGEEISCFSVLSPT